MTRERFLWTLDYLQKGSSEAVQSGTPLLEVVEGVALKCFLEGLTTGYADDVRTQLQHHRTHGDFDLRG